MKKFFKFINLLFSFSLLTACGDSSSPETVKIYAPDGAPALGLSYLMSDSLFDNNVNYEIVDSSLIATFVTGENPRADIAIIPSNVALTKQDIYNNYQILGSITHGNLYILSKEETQLTTSNLSLLLGKNVGVININNVPGIYTKIILDKNNIPYNIVKNDGKTESDKVNLIGIDASQIGADDTMQYYIAAEPAASLKVKMLSSKGLKIVGSLQQLYSEEESYLQALVIAKRSLIKNNSSFIEDFVNQIKNTKTYLETCDVNKVINDIQNHLTDGLAPTFNDKNLTIQTIANCNVYFVDASQIKNELNSTKNEFSSYMNVLEDINDYIYE